MIIETGCLDERRLSIYEHDVINNEKVLIFTVYCVRRDNGIWEFPAPQVFNEGVYKNNQQAYEQQIQSFRNDCMASIPEETSVLISQINQLTKENEMLMKAIAELDELVEK